MHVNQLLATKYNALERFTQQILSSDVKDQIAKMILFGSVARGDAEQDSDVDVLVFGFGDLHKLSEACAEASLDIVMESGEYIQALVYCIDDLSPPQSYFLYRAARDGKEIYSRGESCIRPIRASCQLVMDVDEDELKNREVKDRLVLAQEYLEVAENCLAEGRYRIAVYAAYNVVESCVKGLLLLRSPEALQSHRELIAKFDELYTEHGPLPKKLGRELNAVLELRSRARYDANELISEREAQGAIELAEALMKALKERVQSD